jgi:hypothetical protein
MDSPRYRPINNDSDVYHRLVAKEEKMILQDPGIRAIIVECPDCGREYRIEIVVTETEPASQGQIAIRFRLNDPEWSGQDYIKHLAWAHGIKERAHGES